MDDRTMLELAAKACGWVWHPAGDLDENAAGWIDPATGNVHWEDIWSPLTDDGDALRLAVKLGIDIQQFVSTRMVEAWKHPHQACGEDYGADPCSATRRAIVRAAAAIAAKGGA